MYYATRVKIKKKFGFQWKFAKKAGIHESEVSAILSGRRALSDERRETWARLLQCKKEDVLK